MDNHIKYLNSKEPVVITGEDNITRAKLDRRNEMDNWRDELDRHIQYLNSKKPLVITGEEDIIRAELDEEK